MGQVMMTNVVMKTLSRVTCHASRAMTAPVTAVSGWDAARKELGHLDCAATVMVTAPRSGRRAGNRALVRDVCHI